MLYSETIRNTDKQNYMQVILMRLMSESEYLIFPKGKKFTGSGKLGLTCFTKHTDISVSRIHFWSFPSIKIPLVPEKAGPQKYDKYG